MISRKVHSVKRGSWAKWGAKPLLVLDWCSLSDLLICCERLLSKLAHYSDLHSCSSIWARSLKNWDYNLIQFWAFEILCVALYFTSSLISFLYCVLIDWLIIWQGHQNCWTKHRNNSQEMDSSRIATHNESSKKRPCFGKEEEQRAERAGNGANGCITSTARKRLRNFKCYSKNTITAHRWNLFCSL